jgi:glutathione synthase/RimK-type ligase-like ATP-grasp enzyme
VIIDGHFTHALTKRAKPGDFRVQDDHGGTVHPCTPTAEQVEIAERAISACGDSPAYGRVDLVRRADGRWAVMELELIEPELWLRRHPPAAAAMAAAIAGRLA